MPNLHRQQQKALRELSNNPNIVIKEADKGGAITIINKEDYLHNCCLILADNSTYLKTTSDMVETHNEEAKDIIGNISSNNRSHISQLFLVKATPGTFYALPKLHKLSHLISTNINRYMTYGKLINTTQLIDKANSLNIRPPYRPIVSSKRTFTEHISVYVDSILQPLLHNIPSLITDTNDFLRKLDDINHLITPESTIVTMDVNSLYTNIPHTDCINACRSFLNRHTTDPALINDIPILTDFILTHNLFKFNNDHYLQIKGTAMGTKMAPAYANIIMDAIETSFLSSSPLKPSIYYRYIDDIFLIWPHVNDSLTHVLEHANNIHKNIKFTHGRSKTTLPFLDVSVQIAQNKIFTTLHKKTTDSNSYLHYNSCHPVYIKNSIIYSQFLRCIRICTRNSDFIYHSNELTTHLLHKAQPIKVITKQWNKVSKIPRTELLIQKQQTSPNCLPLVQSYHPTIVPINTAVINEWKRYSNMPAVKHLFSSTTLCAYRQPPNFRQMLVKTRISTTPSITGSKKCMKSRCQICNIIDIRPSLKIPGTNIAVRPGNYYCNSSNVIYLIKCKKCHSGNYRVKHLLSLDSV